jgi:hypothetical protein
MAPDHLRTNRACKPATAVICALVNGGEIGIVPDSPFYWPILVINANATRVSQPSMVAGHLTTCA